MKKTFLLLILSSIFLSGCKFEEAASMGISKEMCSCLFVAQQSEKYCRSIAKEALIAGSYKIDRERKRVYGAGLGYLAVSTIHPKGERFGCIIRAVKREETWERRY